VTPMALAVLLDSEGTLVQTPWEDQRHVQEFRQQTRKKLIELGIPASLLAGIEQSTLMRNTAADFVESDFGKTDARKFHLEMGKFLKLYELDAARRSTLYPETASTLERLRSLGVGIGLVTNTSREAVDIVFRRHKIGNYFDVAVTRDDVKKLKPDPEGLRLAVRKLGARDFIMIGDLPLDISASKEAKGTTVFVQRDQDSGLSVEADYHVRPLADVPTIVQRYLGNRK
jgi:HAD superfamily hydrolase (TIGR01549 family)